MEPPHKDIWLEGKRTIEEQGVCPSQMLPWGIMSLDDRWTLKRLMDLFFFKKKMSWRQRRRMWYLLVLRAENGGLFDEWAEDVKMEFRMMAVQPLGVASSQFWTHERLGSMIHSSFSLYDIDLV
jgi:hypothetical protein